MPKAFFGYSAPHTPEKTLFYFQFFQTTTMLWDNLQGKRNQLQAEKIFF